MAMNAIKLDAPKIAQAAVEGENFAQKAQNAVKLLEEQFDALRADSPKAREFHTILKQNLEDIKGTVAGKISNIATVSGELHRDVLELENGDEIIAQARAATNVESKKTQKARPPR